MEIDEIQKILKQLTKEQIEEVIDYIDKIVDSEVINFDELPKDYRKLVKHFNKISKEDRMYFIKNLINDLENNEEYGDLCLTLASILKRQ